MEAIDEILSRGVAEVIDKENLRQRLTAGKPLRIKLGIDPTSPNIHIGRAVVLLKMRDFQKLGHKIIFIVGDFTGIIGDASDKEAERPMLTEEQVKDNMQSYIDQAGKILDLDQTETHFNSEWLKKLGFKEIGEQANQFSIADFIARENIKKRLDSGKRVSLREVLYPLMQGYDSVQVEADVELGGTDQRFNLLAGRTLQSHYKQTPQDVLMVNLIPGTDGRKMSSSWGNTINITDQPEDMFGKVMSIPDDIIVTYFEHCTRVPMEEVKTIADQLESDQVNPRDLKLRLAQEITKLYHGEESAQKAQEHFVNVFSNREVPSNMPTIKISEDKLNIIDIIVKAEFAASRSEARRLVEQGGVEVDGVKVLSSDQEIEIKNEMVLRVGKLKFVKVIND